MSAMSSKWAALVTEQVKSAMYAFSIVLELVLIKRGLAKSTPILENESFTWTPKVGKATVVGNRKACYHVAYKSCTCE